MLNQPGAAERSTDAHTDPDQRNSSERAGPESLESKSIDLKSIEPESEISLGQSFRRELPTLLIMALIVGGWLLFHFFTGHDSAPEASDGGGAGEVDTIELPQGKLDAVVIESNAVEKRPIREVDVVPGRLRYDPSKHIEVKSPIDGILSELLFEPGMQVQSGDLVAVIRSPEIGRARAEVLKQRKQLELAEQVFERELTVSDNLAKLFAALEQNEPVSDIEEQFQSLALGEYRQKILSSYSRMQLADLLVANVRPLAQSGSIAGKVVSEREAERQQATSDYDAARDQARFAARQAVERAQANVDEAQRQVNLAVEQVSSLLGVEDASTYTAQSDEDSLSRLEIRAPFSGTVESRKYAIGERIAGGDALLVLADTGKLFVEASIREGDWSAVSLEAGTELAVTVPALNGREFRATVRYFGREVLAETNAVPLVAEIENYEGLLRPGMFVRVAVPKANAEMSLSIDPQSLLQHENRQFVFVDLADGRFKRVDVSTGRVTDDWVEIENGLAEGDRVVTRGAFILKSELLLAGED